MGFYNITRLGIPSQDTTYSEATTSSAGLMSVMDKKKLDSIEQTALVTESSTITTTATTLPDSKASALKMNMVRGKSEQEQYKGKNLLKMTPKITTVKGITCTVKDNGYVIVDGTCTDDTTIVLSDEVLPIGSYVMNGCPSGGSTSTYRLEVRRTRGGTNTWLSDLGNGTNLIIDEETTATRVFIGVRSGTTLSNAIFKPMIRLASVTDPTYEPYVGGIASPNPDYPQEIKSVGDGGSLTVTAYGKNIIPYPYHTMNVSSNGGTLVVNDDGGITVRGTPTDNVWLSIYKGKALATSGKHIFSVRGAFSNLIIELILRNLAGERVKVYEFFEDIIINFSDYPTVTDWTLTVKRRFNNIEMSGTMYVMLEESELATTYEPYSKKSVTVPLSEPLRSIGDAKDEILKQDGVWGVSRIIASKVLNGTETWTIGGEGNIVFLNRVFANRLDKSRTVKASHFKEYNGGWINMPVGRIQNYDNAVGIKVEGITTVDELVAWLNKNPVTIQYELTTPVFEPFPDEYQQIFYELESFDTVTHITTDSEAEPEIEVEYALSTAGVHILNNYAKSNMADLKADEAEGLAGAANEIANNANKIASDALPKANITRNTAVTEEGKYALDAVEKNASAPGTLANRISGLESGMVYRCSISGSNGESEMNVLKRCFISYIPTGVAVCGDIYIGSSLRATFTGGKADDYNGSFLLHGLGSSGGVYYIRNISGTWYYSKITTDANTSF